MNKYTICIRKKEVMDVEARDIDDVINRANKHVPEWTHITR